jgi:hypothetical protein
MVTVGQTEPDPSGSQEIAVLGDHA